MQAINMWLISNNYIIPKFLVCWYKNKTQKNKNLKTINSCAYVYLLQYCIQPQDGTNTYQIQVKASLLHTCSQ